MLLEGYDYSLRAQTFRKTGADQVDFKLDPRPEQMALGTRTGQSDAVIVPQINPVFLINGWSSPGARVSIDGEPVRNNGTSHT